MFNFILQVIYNVSSIYDIKYGGERKFTDHLVILQKVTYVELPLYTKNSVYHVQVTAFTTNNERVATEMYFRSSDFDNAGLDGNYKYYKYYSSSHRSVFSDAITYFQLRFILPLHCSTWMERVSESPTALML